MNDLLVSSNRSGSIMLVISIILTFAITSCVAQTWEKWPGSAIDISAKGQELWIINSEHQIYRWDHRFENAGWELKNNSGVGNAISVGASPDGWTWITNSAHEIYRYNLNNSNWDRIPGGLVQISAISRDRALGVNSGGSIYLWENDAWKHLPGGATWAGIGDSDVRWVVHSPSTTIYRWSHEKNRWIHMPGAAVKVDVQNPERVIMTSPSNEFKIWVNETWHQLTGSGTRASINEDKYYTINNAQQIWIGK